MIDPSRPCRHRSLCLRVAVALCGSSTVRGRHRACGGTVQGTVTCFDARQAGSAPLWRWAAHAAGKDCSVLCFNPLVPHVRDDAHPRAPRTVHALSLRPVPVSSRASPIPPYAALLPWCTALNHPCMRAQMLMTASTDKTLKLWDVASASAAQPPACVYTHDSLDAVGSAPHARPAPRAAPPPSAHTAQQHAGALPRAEPARQTDRQTGSILAPPAVAMLSLAGTLTRGAAAGCACRVPSLPRPSLPTSPSTSASRAPRARCVVACPRVAAHATSPF